MLPSKWLGMHAPGYAALARAEKLAIRDFALLWSFFEESWLANYGNVRAIVAAVDQRVTNTISIAPLLPALNHFQGRYYVGGRFTQSFSGLRFQPSDQRSLVESVLSGALTDNQSVIKALLIIVFRLRNNFLHGEKWAYGFQDQLLNFKHANDVLMKVMSL